MHRRLRSCGCIKGLAGPRRGLPMLLLLLAVLRLRAASPAPRGSHTPRCRMLSLQFLERPLLRPLHGAHLGLGHGEALVLLRIAVPPLLPPFPPRRHSGPLHLSDGILPGQPLQLALLPRRVHLCALPRLPRTLMTDGLGLRPPVLLLLPLHLLLLPGRRLLLLCGLGPGPSLFRLGPQLRLVRLLRGRLALPLQGQPHLPLTLPLLLALLHLCLERTLLRLHGQSQLLLQVHLNLPRAHLQEAHSSQGS